MQSIKRDEFGLSAAELAEILSITPQAVYQKLKASGGGTRHPEKGYILYSPDVRNLFLERGIKYEHKVVTFACAKGGVGKTSLAYSFAIRANMFGARVLCLDLDMQGHLTLAFTTEENNLLSENVPVFGDLLNGEKASIKDLIVPITSSFHLIPSNLDNSTVETTLSSNRKINLKNAVANYLETLKDDYDYIVIDTAPGFSGINVAAFCASDLVIVPAAPDRFGIDGVRKTVTELSDIKSNYELNFDVRILLNRYDARKKLSVTQFLKLQSEFPNLLLPCYVRENSEIPNATAKGTNVFEASRKRTPAKEDLDVLAREILNLRS